MSVPPRRAIAIPLDDDRKIGIDVACPRCDYNLRGLPVDGNCPECGAPVAFVTGGYYFEHAPAGWVRTLERGLRWYVIAIIVGFVLGVVAVALLSVFLLSTGSTTGGASMNLIQQPWFAAILPVLINVLVAIAYFRLVTPEPGGPEEGTFSPRRLLHLGAWLYVLAVAATIASAASWLLLGPVPGVVATGALVGIFSQLMDWLTTLFMLQLLVGWMPRVRRRGLAKFAKVLLWVTAVFGLLTLVVSAWAVPEQWKMAALTSNPGAAASTPASTAAMGGTRGVAAPFAGGPMLKAAGTVVGCVAGIVGVASFIFFLMAWRAVGAAAKAAEARAGVMQAPSG